MAQVSTAKRIWSHFDVVPEERKNLKSISRQFVQFKGICMRALLSRTGDVAELEEEGREKDRNSTIIHVSHADMHLTDFNIRMFNIHLCIRARA